MHRKTEPSFRFLSRGRVGFLFGSLFGMVVALAGSAVAQLQEKDTEFVQAVLYAIGELAVDSERNAISIVELRERLNDLELRVEEIAPGEKAN